MPIDLSKELKDLYAHREQLDYVIASIEAYQQGLATGPPPQAKTNRGRKSMGSEERREVSERMRKYWAGRPKKKTPPAS